MSLLHSKMSPLGTPAYSFTLVGVDDKMYSLNSFTHKDVLIIIFMCNHCPYVKAVIHRLVEIQHDYQEKSVQLVGINSNDDIAYPQDSFDKMKIFAQEQAITFPYLRDKNQDSAKKYDAVCTPDIFMYGQSRKLLYRGRIDDNWQDSTKVTQNDLRLAIDASLEGSPVAEEQIASMGCSIKWKG